MTPGPHVWAAACTLLFALIQFGIRAVGRGQQRSGLMAAIVEKGHWTREQIAVLQDWQLARFNYDELVEIVLASGVLRRDGQRVSRMEGDALVRLAGFARQHCSTP